MFDQIDLAISELIEGYQREPLRLIREIGIQAQLRQVLQQRLNEVCSAQIRQGRRLNPTRHTVERVQMELRVQDESGHGPQKSDVVVLRSTQNAEPITLTRYPNGPFDIVSKLPLKDAAAVIEVKAACSADPQQRHLFRCDVSKLLDLAEACPPGQPHPALHFLLIDKSIGVDDHPAFADRMPILDWHAEPQDRLDDLTDHGLEEFWLASPRIELKTTQPENGPFVHVWMMNHIHGKADGAPLHRYASRCCQR